MDGANLKELLMWLCFWCQGFSPSILIHFDIWIFENFKESPLARPYDQLDFSKNFKVNPGPQ